MAPSEFNGIFCTILLGWSGNSLYIVSVNDQEFNSFRRKTRSKASHDFRLLHR